MNIFEFIQSKPELLEQEQASQVERQQIYDYFVKSIDQRSELERKAFESFNRRTGVYNPTPLNFSDSAPVFKAIKEQEEEQLKRKSLALGFVESFMPEESEEAKRIQQQQGTSVPMLQYDLEGDLKYVDRDSYQQAVDYSSYGFENQRGLFGIEYSSRYNITNAMMANSELYDKLRERNPTLFPEPTGEEQALINSFLKYRGSWQAMSSYIPILNLFILTGVINPATEGNENASEIIPFFGNVQSMFSDSVLPTDMLFSRKQEGWDGKKAWEVLQEEHPAFAAYMTDVVGLNVDNLSQTNNQYDWRYVINNSLQTAAAQTTISDFQYNANFLEKTGDTIWQFAKQSALSVDMPAELAITVGTGLVYGAAALGTRLIQSTRAAYRMKRGLDVLETTASIGRSTQRLGKIQQVIKGVQAYTIPSNWGHLVVNGFKTEGIRWGTGRGFGYRLAQMTAVDFGQGLVEGALYSIQNQAMDSHLFSTDKLWTEMWQEGIGQAIFGKVFRGINWGVGSATTGVGDTLLLNKVWSRVSSLVSPEIKELVKLQSGIQGSDLTPEQKQLALTVGISMIHQHVGFQQMTGKPQTGMPPVVMQTLAAIQEQGKQNGTPVDFIGIMEKAVKDLDGKTLSDEEATLYLVSRVVDTARSLQIPGFEPNSSMSVDQVVRLMVRNNLIEAELKDKGLDPVNKPTEYERAFEEAENKIAENPDLIQAEVDVLMKIAKDLKSRMPSLFSDPPLDTRPDWINLNQAVDALPSDTREEVVTIINESERGNVEDNTEEWDRRTKEDEPQVRELTRQMDQGMERWDRERIAAEAPTEAPTEAAPEAAPEAPTEAAPKAAPTDPSPRKLNAFAKLKAKVDDARSRNLGPKEVLNRLHNLKRSYRLAIESDNADPSHPAMVDIDNYIQEIETELAQQGYEIEDPIGSLWDEGRADLKVVAFNPNPETDGKEIDEVEAIIVDVEKPIIRKDGEIIQIGHVVAEDRPLSDSEIAAKIEQEKSIRQRLEERTSEAAPEAPDPEEATLEDFMNWEDDNRYTIAQIDKAVKDGIITELRGEMIKRAIVKLRGKGDAEMADFNINFASGNVVGAKEIFTHSLPQLEAIARWAKGVKTPEQIARETARATAKAVAETAEAPTGAPAGAASETPKPVSQAQEQVKPTPPIPQTITKQPRITRAQNRVQENLLEEYKRKHDCL